MVSRLFSWVFQVVLQLVVVLSIQSQKAASFKWEATLDRSTGVASSKEVSVLTIENDNQSIDSTQRQRSKDLVASWTDFLCQGSVTLGLLQAKHDPKSGKAFMHLKGFPTRSILTFGPLQESGKNAWELPISQSWLALPDPIRPSRFGCLRFELKLSKPRTSQGQRLMSTYELQSNIVDYRPWLVGPSPVSRTRQYLYLHSQSWIHAYVTWRFHKAWRQALCSPLHSTYTTNKK